MQKSENHAMYPIILQLIIFEYKYLLCLLYYIYYNIYYNTI